MAKGTALTVEDGGEAQLARPQGCVLTVACSIDLGRMASIMVMSLDSSYNVKDSAKSRGSVGATNASHTISQP